MLKKSLKILTSTLILLLIMTPSVFALDEVVLGGDTVGINLNYDGILITGSYEFDVNGTTIDPDSNNQLKSGDLILEVNNQRVRSISEFYQCLTLKKERINQYPITIKRGNQLIETNLNVYYLPDEDVYKTGYYVKEKISGVGTVTFYDPIHGVYGALGHEIFDSDQQNIASFSSGFISRSLVTSIKKSVPGNPGEKISSIQNAKIGSISKNNEFGLYGKIIDMPTDHPVVAIASQDEIHLGKALIYTVVNQDRIETFEIDITRINYQSSSDIKGLEFVIHDPRLLQLTGGIIQGMSGSPIVQDGKIIGAITHMITSDPTRGYGIFIEWMIEESLN